MINYVYNTKGIHWLNVIQKAQFESRLRLEGLP